MNMQATPDKARPLAECRQEDLVSHHALVYGRVRCWHTGLTETNEHTSHWSKSAWWKAMWYPHRGEPSNSAAWGVYGGNDAHTGTGDAELTHFLPMPPVPEQ